MEDELDMDQVEVWADAPEDLRRWRGGIRIAGADGTGELYPIEEG